MRSLCFLLVFVALTWAQNMYIGGDFVSSKQFYQGDSPFLMYDTSVSADPNNPNQPVDNWKRPAISNINLNGAVQLSGGRFAWISSSGTAVSVYDSGTNVWTNLGLENGVFGTLEEQSEQTTNGPCCPNRNGWQTITGGTILKIAASGNYIMACGTFNTIGDLEQGTQSSAPTVLSSTNSKVWPSTISVAVFNLADNAGAFGNQWKVVWPTGYSGTAASTATPFPLSSCDTLFGWGAQGNFLMDEVPPVQAPFGNIVKTWRWSATAGTWSLFQDNYNRELSTRGSYKPVGETLYLFYKINGQQNPAIFKRSSADAAYTAIVTLTTNGATLTNFNGYGNKLTDYTVDTNGNIFALLKSSLLVAGPNKDKNDHYGEYVWQLASGKTSEADFARITVDRTATSWGTAQAGQGDVCNDNMAPQCDLSIAGKGPGTIYFDPVYGKLITYGSGSVYNVISNGKDPTTAPRDDWDPYVLTSYDYDNYYGKKYVTAMAFGSTWGQAYNGGIDSWPGYGNPSGTGARLGALAGEKISYFIQSSKATGYQTISRNIATLRSGQWQTVLDSNNKVVLPNGVDADSSSTPATDGIVNVVLEYNGGWVIAGYFRTIDGTEVFSLVYWKDGKFTSYPVRSIPTTTGDNGRFVEFRTPGTITNAVISGNILYIAGFFNWVGDATNGKSCAGVASLDLSQTDAKLQWSNMLFADLNNGVTDMLKGNDGNIYFASTRGQAGLQLTNTIVRWTQFNRTCCWEPLNFGLGGTPVNHLLQGEDGVLAIGGTSNAVTDLNPLGSTSTNFTMSKWVGNRWVPFDLHWDTECFRLKFCKPTGLINSAYVFGGKIYATVGAATGSSQLWEFDGARWRYVVDHQFGGNGGKFLSIGLGYSGVGGQLIRWGPGGSTTFGKAIAHDCDLFNGVQTTQGVNTPPNYQTQIDGAVSSFSTLLKPAITLIALVFVTLFL